MPKPKELDPIDEKTEMLYEFDLTDKNAVKAYLIRETAGITDPVKLEMKLERLARTMIMRRFDGDRQFVLKGNGNEKENENSK